MSTNSSEPPSQQPSEIPLPSRVPPPTGNIISDSIESAKHITEIPCSRNSLLSGIASGVGIGVIRGLSTGRMIAGHWAFATFTIISLGSWHLCQKQIADERKKVARIIESMPQRSIKQPAGETESPSTTTPL